MCGAAQGDGRDGGREEGKGSGLAPERREGFGGWDMGNPGNSESSLVGRRRSEEGREKGLNRLLHKAVLTLRVFV